MAELTRIVVGPRVQARWPDGSTVEVTGKAAMLLAMVALEGHAERRRLALLLWPDSAHQQALNNLRTLVHRLNQRFGGELVTGAEQLHIDSAQARVTLQDSDELLTALGTACAERCELLAEAGIETGAAVALDNWLEAARQRLHRIQLATLSEALGPALAEGRAERAIALARACVQLEPLSEHWHRQLMDTLVHCGDRAAALVAYEDCKLRLRQALGVMPDLQTRAVHLRILQDEARHEPGAKATTAPTAPTAASIAGLTPLGGAARYPMVERDTVLAEVQAALAHGQHVALQGEAGVGKTRLLRQLAEKADPRCIEQVAIRPGARNEPYAALAQVLQDVQPRRAPRIGIAEQVELARLAPTAFSDVKPSEASLSVPRLHAALRHWAGRLKDTGVAWLVLDDVHYADVASQSALAALLAQPDENVQALPTMLLAHRTDEIDAALAEALVAAQVCRRLRSIALARLSLQGVTALLEAMHAEHSQAQAARLLQRTGGNPLFVIELAQHALDQAEHAHTGPAGANLEALLRSRLAGCSAAAQQLAAVAAVAAADFSVELAVAAMGQPALALMPAWTELQHRGLFADHGLAHDLVREAVLGVLPNAIGRTLHRQVAGYLEAQGLKGAQVLGHWLAAEDFDHALPHAVHHMDATQSAGLSTQHLDMDLLGLVERVSDRVLLDHLWVTAEVGDWNRESVQPEVWPRLGALLARVKRFPDTATSASWIAFETSRQIFYFDRSAKDAYAVLSHAMDSAPERGVARVRSELLLTVYAANLDGDTREHLRRAQHALTEQPDDLLVRRVQTAFASMAAIFLSPIEVIKTESTKMRAARRRGDLAQAAAARLQIALLHATAGHYTNAHRHFDVATRLLVGEGENHDVSSTTISAGFTALNSGRFDAALRHFGSVRDVHFLEQRPLFVAMLWLRLGDVKQAMNHARDMNPEPFRRQFHSLFHWATVQAELERQSGQDPLPALQRTLADMRQLGVGGTNLDLMEWQVARHVKPAAERVTQGHALLAALKSQGAIGSRIVRTALEVAEAQAEIDDPAGQVLATEAARLLRRGCTALTLYVPDGLMRCARLLEASDPGEAATLAHVARRWVNQALSHVPPDARASFAAVPVNRLLLGHTAAAAGAETPT